MDHANKQCEFLQRRRNCVNNFHPNVFILLYLDFQRYMSWSLIFVLSPCFICIPVYHEKFLTLGNTEAAPAQKAMTSVIDVIVIATAL
jgi:hypothetical protein